MMRGHPSKAGRSAGAVAPSLPMASGGWARHSRKALAGTRDPANATRSGGVLAGSLHPDAVLLNQESFDGKFKFQDFGVVGQFEFGEVAARVSLGPCLSGQGSPRTSTGSPQRL